MILKLDSRGPQTFTARFDSWYEFLDFITTAPKTHTGYSAAERIDVGWTSSFSFTRTESMTHALRLATDGWQEGTDLISRVSLSEFTKVAERIERPVYFYDVEGIGFDVARVLDGEPEVWMRQEEIITDGPGRRIFHVVMNCAVSAGVDSNIIMQRGAACCALIQALEMSGHGVDLTLAHNVGGGDFGSKVESDIYIKLKSADQPLDLARAAFSLAHPSTLRRLLFAAQERLPYPKTYSVGSAYGYPPFDAPERGDICLDGASIYQRDWNNPAVTEAWILDTLKKQGVHIKEERG